MMNTPLTKKLIPVYMLGVSQPQIGECCIVSGIKWINEPGTDVQKAEQYTFVANYDTYSTNDPTRLYRWCRLDGEYVDCSGDQIWIRVNDTVPDLKDSRRFKY